MAETKLKADEIGGLKATEARVGFKTRHLRWLIIGLVFLATLINYIDRLTISVLAPVITESLKLSNLQYASLGTWFLLAYTISQSISGRIFDRIGVRRGFILSITVWSLAAMAHAFARGLGSLSVFRFLLGLGEAGNWPGAAKVVAEWFPVRERAFAMAIFNSGAAIGSIVAPPLIVLLQLRYGWQATFIITGTLGFFWLALWLFFYESPERHRWMKDGETERRRDGETERRRDGEGESTRPSVSLSLHPSVSPSLRLSVPLSLHPSVPPSLHLQNGFDLKKIGLFAWVPFVAADAGSLLGGFASGYLIKRGWSVNRARKATIGFAALLMPAGILAARAADPMVALALIGLVLFGFQFWINNVQTLPSDFFSDKEVASVAGLGGTGAGVGSMIFNLSGKVALVTGASSGIGKAAAIALAEQGAAVAINYHRNEAGAGQTKKEIVAAGGRAITIQADVTKSEDVRSMVEQTVAAFGPVNILVNNAGSLVERLRLLELTEARWDEVIDLNLKSAFLCAQAVAASMIERKSGVIVNISSIAGRNGGALGSIHYSTAKGGLITMTKGLAKELAPHGVRVNAVSPGVIDTPFHEQFSTPEALRNFVNNIPLGRVGAPDEIARVIVFLASDASSYLIGETIEVNGGMLMD